MSETPWQWPLTGKFCTALHAPLPGILICNHSNCWNMRTYYWGVLFQKLDQTPSHNTVNFTIISSCSVSVGHKSRRLCWFISIWVHKSVLHISLESEPQLMLHFSLRVLHSVTRGEDINPSCTPPNLYGSSHGYSNNGNVRHVIK